MKSIISFLFFIFWINFSFSQLKDTLYGNVKSIREELTFLDKDRQNYRLFSVDGDYGHSGFSSNEFTKERFYTLWYKTPYVHYLNYFKEFNQRGQPTKEIWFYKNGNKVKEYNYKYQDSTGLIQIVEIIDEESYRVTNKSYDYNNKLKAQISYYSDEPQYFFYNYNIYDDNLRIIETNSYDSEGAISGTKTIYDEEGRIKKNIIRDYWVRNYKDGRIHSYGPTDYATDKLKDEFFYNTDGNLAEIFHYNKASIDENQVELKGKTKNFYFKNGLIEYIVKTTAYDTINSLIRFKYDKLGRKVEEMIVYPNHIKSEKNIKIFDKNILKLDNIYFPKIDFKIARIENYVYDYKNLTKLIYQEDSRKVVCKFEYVFDEKNNWIEQVKYINGEKLYVWKRQITYW